MKLLRTMLFWSHLASGVAAGLIILLMSATGILLTYEKQIIARANTSTCTVAPASPEASPMSIEALLTRVAEQQGEMPSNITLRSGQSSAVEVSYGRDKTLFVDPYSGQVLGAGALRLRGFFASVMSWHRWPGGA